MNERNMNDLLAQIAAQDWNGPGTNERVERFILERKHAMSKKQKLIFSGIVLGASLISAGVAAAVTHQIVSQRFQIVTDDGKVFEGELITPMTPGNANAKFITDDGSVYELEMDPGTGADTANTGD